jgi:hypothetical protein
MQIHHQGQYSGFADLRIGNRHTNKWQFTFSATVWIENEQDLADRLFVCRLPIKNFAKPIVISLVLSKLGRLPI